MRPSPSTCASRDGAASGPEPRCPRGSRALGAAIAAAIVASPAALRAQPCCGGASAFSPARLTSHEDGLVGVSMRAAGVVGSFDAERAFAASRAGAREVDLAEDVFVAARVLADGQVSLTVPLVQTVRVVPGRSEAGGGAGDLALGARWDVTTAGRSLRWPGIAALASFTLPTGVAPEAARHPLATDATGTGAFAATLGASVEHTMDKLLLHATGAASWRAPRTVGAVRVQAGPAFTVLAGASYYLPREAFVSLAASYTGELAPREDGEPVVDGGRAATRVTLSGGVPLSREWRVQASVSGDLPIRGFGQGQPAVIGGALLVVRGFR